MNKQQQWNIWYLVGAFALLRYSMATAPATAIIEPTDRSIPPVAITRHIPVAIMISGAAARAMSTRLPTNAPVCELYVMLR